MSTLSSLFIFLLCLSTHACVARLLTKDEEMIKDNGSIERGGGFSYQSESGATTDMLEEPKAKGKLSGSENKDFFSHMGLLQLTKIEGSRRQARSLLGSGSQVKEQATEFMQYEAQKDAALMDYEPPHRKPPIHNREN